MKRLGVFLVPNGGRNCESKVSKNTAQCPQPGLEPKPLDPETRALTMRRQMRQMRAASKQKQNNNNKKSVKVI